MLTTAPSATDRFLAELRAARDDAALSEVNPDGSLDPYESASFVINNLAAIRYALGSGMPVIAWEQALKNEAGSEYVLRSVRQFQEQAMLLVLAYTSGTIALDTFRTALVREFRQQSRNSYIAGRRAMGDLSALDRDEEAALDALVDDDASDLADGMDVGPDVTGAVAGGSLIGAIGSMVFDPSNFLGSGLPGDPFANLPAPIGAGKHAASDAAKHTATAALKGTVSPTAKAASDAAMATYGKAMAGYADRIRAVSHAGELSALAGLPGDATLVWWNLGAADHCIDCIRLADASPFYVSAFSATGIYPGSGHTRCGGACRCSLDYDLPSQVCGDTLADDLGGLVESVNRQTPDGTRLNVWLQEAVSCNLPINVDALQAAEDYSVIDDESAFTWDDDVASMIGGSIEEDTVTWAEVVGKVLPYQQGVRMRRAFEQIAAEVPPADLRLTRYTTNSTEYVAAWHQSGSSIIFDAGFTTAGPTVFDADYTLHALGDLAAYARLSGRDLSIRGDYAGKGLQGWLNALGAPQQVLPGSAPTIPIDWTKLPGPAEVVPAAVTEPNPALVQMLADAPLAAEPIADARSWTTATDMITDLERRYPGAQFGDLAKLDFAITKPAMEQMDDLFTRFGAIPSFRGVRVTDKTSGTAIAVVKGLPGGEAGSAIFLPKPIWKDRPTLEQFAAKQADPAFSTASAVLAKDATDLDGYTRSIITHEVGHEYMGISLHARFGAKGDDVRAAVDGWFAGAVKTAKTAHLTKYARTNPHELWGEAFTAAVGATPIQTPGTDALRAILDEFYPPAATAVGPLLPANPKQVASSLTARFKVWLDALPEDQQAAINKYTQGTASAINDLLRGTYTPQQAELSKALGVDLQAMVKSLDAAFEDVPKASDPQLVLASTRMDKPMVVYRGRSLDVIPEVGDLVTEPGFLSTTIDPAVAAKFSLGQTAAGKQAVVYRIALPKGTRGLWTDEKFAYSEGELILQRGSKFRVVGKTADVTLPIHEAPGAFEKVTVVDVVPEPKALVPEGPPIPAETNAFRPGDPQQYIIDPATPPLNAPLAEWSGFVPPEPPLPQLKATPEQIDAARKAGDEARIRWTAIDADTPVAVSWSQKETTEALAAGYVSETLDGVHLISKNADDLNPLRDYLAVKGHTSDDDAFWAILGYDQEALDRIDTAATITKGKRLTAGVMVFEPDGRVWVLAPKNKFAGYENTVIKGGVDPGESAAAGALRELREESGLSAELDGFVGDYTNTDGTALTRMYVGHRTGGGPLFADQKETYRVRLLTGDEAKKALTRYGKPNERDQAILADALEAAVGKPSTARFVIPSAELDEFAAVTRPAFVSPPAVPSRPEPPHDPRAFALEPIQQEPPPSTSFGYDHGAVMQLQTVYDIPPSDKFPIAQTRWTLPGGDIQRMFWKREPGAGGERMFWMNSKQQVADPTQRLHAHVAQLLRFRDQMAADGGLAGLRVNEALLDQVPKLREMLIAAGATKPSPKVLELSMAQLDDLATAIANNTPLPVEGAVFATAPLVNAVPDLPAILAPTPKAGLEDALARINAYKAKVAAGEATWYPPDEVAPWDVLTKTVPTGKPGLVEGKWTGWHVVSDPAKFRLYALNDDTGNPAAVMVVAVGQNKHGIAERIVEVRTRSDLTGQGWATKLYDAVQDGTDLNIYDAVAQGNTEAGAKFVSSWLEHRQTLTGTADVLPDVLAAPGLATPPLAAAQIDTVTASKLRLAGNTITPGDGTLTHTSTWEVGGKSAVFKTDQETSVLTLWSAEMDLPAAGVSGRAAMAAAELNRLADLIELMPDVEGLEITPAAWTKLPVSIQKMLNDVSGNTSFGPASLTTDELLGVREMLNGTFPVIPLPPIVVSVPESLAYTAADVLPYIGQPWTNGVAHLGSTTGTFAHSELAAIFDDMTTTFRVTALHGEEPRAIGGLYDLAARAKSKGAQLAVPESLVTQDMAAALVAAGGERRAGLIVVSKEELDAFQTALLPAGPAAPVAVAAPVSSVPAGKGMKLLAGANAPDDSTISFAVNAMTGSGTPQAMKLSKYPTLGGGGIVWRRLGNTLEVHQVQTSSVEVIKAHLVRMGQLADTTPKIDGLRLVPDAVASIKGTDLDTLLLDAGAKVYPGGYRLSREQLLSVRDKVLTDAGAAAPSPAAAVEPVLISPATVAEAKAMTYAEEQLKQGFTKFSWAEPGGSPVIVVQRNLSKQKVWSRTQGATDEGSRMAASVRHLMKLGEVDLPANPAIESIRFENLAQLPAPFVSMLQTAGATGTNEVLVLAREDAVSLAKALSADVNGSAVADAITVAIAPPAPPAALQGLLGLAGHDPVVLADLQKSVPPAIAEYANSWSQAYVTPSGKVTAYRTASADGKITYWTSLVAGPAVPDAAVQAAFLRHLQLSVGPAAAGLTELRIGTSAFVGQAGHDMRTFLLGLGAEQEAGDVVIKAPLAKAIEAHLVIGTDLLPLSDAIAAPIPPLNAVTAGAKMSQQFGYDSSALTGWDSHTAAATFKPTTGVVQMYSPAGGFEVHFDTGVTIAGQPMLILSTAASMPVTPTSEGMLASLFALRQGMDAKGASHLRVWTNAYSTPSTSVFHDVLLAAGGVEGAYGIDLDVTALDSLLGHMSTDSAMHTLPKGAGAPHVPGVPGYNLTGIDPDAIGEGVVASGSGYAGDPYVVKWGDSGITTTWQHSPGDKSLWLWNGMASGGVDEDTVVSVMVAQLHALADLVQPGESLRVTSGLFAAPHLPDAAKKQLGDILHGFGAVDVAPHMDITYDHLQALKSSIDNQLLSTPVTNVPVGAGPGGWMAGQMGEALTAIQNIGDYTAGGELHGLDFTFGGTNWGAGSVHKPGAILITKPNASVAVSPETSHAAAAAYTMFYAQQAGVESKALILTNSLLVDHPGLETLASAFGNPLDKDIRIEWEQLDDFTIALGDWDTASMAGSTAAAGAVAVTPATVLVNQVPASVGGPSIAAVQQLEPALVLGPPKLTVTEMKAGFSNYAYEGYGSVKGRLSGKTLTWESTKFASSVTDKGKASIGFIHLGTMGDVLDANLSVSLVRFFKTDTLPQPMRDVLDALGAKPKAGTDTLEIAAGDFKAALKVLQDDLEGKGAGIAPSIVVNPATPSGAAAIMPLHQKTGFDGALIKTFAPTHDSWPPYYYGATKFVNTIGNGDPTGWASFYTARQKARLVWYGTNPATALQKEDVAAAAWVHLQFLLTHAADTDLPLVIAQNAARKAGTEIGDLLFQAGAKKKKFAAYGESWVLDKAQVKKLLADMTGDPLVPIAKVAPGPSAAIDTVGKAALPSPAPAVAVGAAVPTPVPAVTISDTYGFSGDGLKAIASPKNDIEGATPHGSVYTSTITTTLGTTVGTVRWAEEKLGDAFVLHLRGATGPIGTGKATSLASALMAVFPDHMAGSKWTQLLVDKKALTDTKLGEMLAAFGAKETKTYYRLTADQVTALSAALVKDEADWVGAAVVPKLAAAVPTTTVKLVAGVPQVPTPSFVYGFDSVQVKAWAADAPVKHTGLINTGETKDILSPLGSNAGLAWSVSPSGKAIGVFDVIAGANDAETRDAAFAMLRHVVSEGQARWTGSQQGEKLFFKPDAYDKVPGLRQMLIDAGGKPTQYPKLGEAIELTPDQAAKLVNALTTDTLTGLTVSIAKTSEYLGFDSGSVEKLLTEVPSTVSGGWQWVAAGDKVQTRVTIANGEAVFSGLAGGGATAHVAATVAELNHIADIGVNKVTITADVLGLVPKLDKFLLASGGTVVGDTMVLDAAAINRVRLAISKDALPVLLGGKPLPFSIIDELAANASDAVAAAQSVSVQGTTTVFTAEIKGAAVGAKVTIGPSNLFWESIEVPAGATVGNVRAATATHLRSLINMAAQNGAVQTLDVSTTVFRDAPTLRAVLAKYGARESSSGKGTYLTLNRTQIAKLRTEMEAEIAAYTPAGTSYIGKQAIAIKWPTADELTAIPLVDPVTFKPLTGQTAKNLFSDKAGNQWLFKPGETGRGAVTDEAAAWLARLVGLPVPPVRRYTLLVNGKPVTGSLQKMVPNARSIKSLSELSNSQTSEMLRHSVLDWLTNNDDAHIGNWLVDPDGHLWAIDKTRSWTTLNDGAHDVLRTSNEGNGGGTPLLFKFWRDVAQDPSLLAKVKPQDLAPTLRAVRNMSDEEFLRIVRPVAETMNRGKYAGKPDQMLAAMLARKHSVATDFEAYFKHEVDALRRTRPSELPVAWKKWLDDGATFNLDATPEDLWHERRDELNGIFGVYSPSEYTRRAQAGHLGKVRSQITSYFGGGASGHGSGKWGSELIRPRLSPAQEQEWRQLNEWAILNIVSDPTLEAPAYGQAAIMRKWFNPETGKVRLVRSTNRYSSAGGRLDDPAAYVAGMKKDGLRNMFGTAINTHVIVGAHGGVFYYLEVDPDQIFSWWGLGYGASAGESELLVADPRPDQVLHIRPQTNRMDLNEWLKWDGGPLYK